MQLIRYFISSHVILVAVFRHTWTEEEGEVHSLFKFFLQESISNFFKHDNCLLSLSAFNIGSAKHLLFINYRSANCSDRLVFFTCLKPLTHLFHVVYILLMSALGCAPPNTLSVFLVFLSNSSISFCVHHLILAV